MSFMEIAFDLVALDGLQILSGEVRHRSTDYPILAATSWARAKSTPA